MCDYAFGYAAFPLGEQLPLFGGAVDLRRRNTALLSGGSVVAPHRRANAKAGESKEKMPLTNQQTPGTNDTSFSFRG